MKKTAFLKLIFILACTFNINSCKKEELRAPDPVVISPANTNSNQDGTSTDSTSIYDDDQSTDDFLGNSSTDTIEPDVGSIGNTDQNDSGAQSGIFNNNNSNNNQGILGGLFNQNQDPSSPGLLQRIRDALQNIGNSNSETNNNNSFD